METTAWVFCSGLRNDSKYGFIEGKVCNRKLFLYDISFGQIEIETKCPRCGAINNIFLLTSGNYEGSK